MSSLIRYEHPQNTLSEFLDEFFKGSGFEAIGRHINGTNWPCVDLIENDTNYILKADLPGLAKNDISVTIEHGILKIEGEKKEEKREDRNKYFHLERSYGKFSRSFTLPDEIDTNRIEAKMNNGVLELVFPKNENAKPRTIEIQVQ